MMNLANILQLKFPTANFITDIVLQDIGDGPTIIVWNIPDVSFPTSDDLIQWASDVDLEYRQLQVMAARKSAYPSLNQQFDMQYWDAINGTTTWQDAVAAVKTANPIPMV